VRGSAGFAPFAAPQVSTRRVEVAEEDHRERPVALGAADEVAERAQLGGALAFPADDADDDVQGSERVVDAGVEGDEVERGGGQLPRRHRGDGPSAEQPEAHPHPYLVGVLDRARHLRVAGLGEAGVKPELLAERVGLGAVAERPALLQAHDVGVPLLERRDDAALPSVPVLAEEPPDIPGRGPDDRRIAVHGLIVGTAPGSRNPVRRSRPAPTVGP
jgi:hypothetical protein